MFDDFLAALSHDKRKKIRQERKRVFAAGAADAGTLAAGVAAPPQPASSRPSAVREPSRLNMREL